MGNQGARDWSFLFYGTGVQTIQGRAFLLNSRCFLYLSCLSSPPSHSRCEFSIGFYLSFHLLVFYVIWKKHLYSYAVEISRGILSDIV